jgi:hypothetical protein
MSHGVFCICDSFSAAQTIAQVLSPNGYQRADLELNTVPTFQFQITLNTNRLPATIIAVPFPVFALAFSDPPVSGPDCFLADLRAVVPLEQRPLCHAVVELARACSTLLVFSSRNRRSLLCVADVVTLCLRENPGLAVYAPIFGAITRGDLVVELSDECRIDPRLLSSARFQRELEFRSAAAFSPLVNALGEVLEQPFVFSFAMLTGLAAIAKDFLRRDSEPSYTLKAVVERDRTMIHLKWRRDGSFCQFTCSVYMTCIFAAPRVAKVVSVDAIPKIVPKPFPLTCRRLLTEGSRYLGLDPKTIFDSAMTLYEGGFISHPYTESDTYPLGWSPDPILSILCGYAPVAQIASSLRRSEIAFNTGTDSVPGFLPIYPSAVPRDIDRKSNEYKLYDFIARWFLASCHSHSVVAKVHVTFSLGAELFSHTFVTHQDLNWLSVFPFAQEKIAKIDPLPSCVQIGAEFSIKSLLFAATNPPELMEVPIGTLLQPSQPAAESMFYIADMFTQGLIRIGEIGFQPTARGLALVLAFEAAGFDFGSEGVLDMTNRAFTEIAAGNDQADMKIMSVTNTFLSKIMEKADEIRQSFAKAYLKYTQT